MTDLPKVTTTAVCLDMSPTEREAHRELLQRFAETRNANRPMTAQAYSLDQLLNLTAEPKATALAGLARHLGKDQATIIFCRNIHERDLAAAACQEAGHAPMLLGAEPEASQVWEDHGGIIIAVTGADTVYPDLIHARRAIHFGRFPNQERLQGLRDALNRSSRQAKLEITHLITTDSADEVIAKALVPERAGG